VHLNLPLGIVRATLTATLLLPQLAHAPRALAQQTAAPHDHAPLSFVTNPFSQVQEKLEPHGIRLNLFVNDQYQAVLAGADTNGCGRNAASMDLFLTFDLEKLGVAARSDVLLHFQSNWGNGINGRTGALMQVNDDADGDLGGHIAQLWYRTYFFDGATALQLGFLDYQTILDRNAYANSEDKQFWHQTLDNNPMVPLNIGLGAALTIHPKDSWTLVVGAGDGQSVLYKPGFSTAFHDEASFFGFLEGAVHIKRPSDRGELPGNCRVGLIYDPRSKTILERARRPRQRSGDVGMYVSLDQMVYRESPDDQQGLGVFGRFGYRDPDVSRMARFWSAGFQYQGLVPGRDDDVLGLAFSLQRSGHKYRRHVDRASDNETVYELYYAIRVSPNLVVTPDIQYIDNPGTTGTLSHALVAGVRLRLSL